MSKYAYYLEDTEGCAIASGIRHTVLAPNVSMYSAPVVVEFQSAKAARAFAETHFPGERFTVKAWLRSAVSHDRHH